MNKIKTLIIHLLTVLFLISSVSAFSYQILSTNPAPVQAGEFADVTVRIDTFLGSDSSTINNIVISPMETDFIKPVPGLEVRISSLQTGQSITRTFRVFFSENIPTGEIPLTLVYQVGNQRIEQSDMIFVSGTPRKPELFIGQIRSVPDKLLANTKSNRLNIVLQNLGQRNAELVTVDLITNSEIISQSYSFSMRDSLASINTGEQQQVSFTFDIENTDQLTVPAQLNLRYRTLNTFDNTFSIIEETIDFEIKLTPSPRFQIVNVEQLTSFGAGTSGNRMLVTIQNIGEREGNTVRLRLFPDPAAPFDFERTTLFVSSNIKPDETVSFIIPLDILNDALVQNYFVNADFESIVGDNRYVQSERIEINVTSEASRGIQLYITLLILLSLGIALSIGFFYNRNNKKK